MNRKLYSRIKDFIVNNLISLVSLLGPILVSIVTLLWKKLKKEFTTLDIILIVIFLISFVFIVIYMMWRNISYRSCHYPYSKIKPDYIVVKKELNYRKTDDNKLKFSNEQTIKSITQQLDRVQGRYMWTGTGKINLPKTNNGCEIRSEGKKVGVWNYYDIIIHSPLQRGDEKIIKNNYIPIDNCTSSSPFVSTCTEQPTKLLVFKIDLGNEYANKEVILESYRSNESYFLLSKEIFTLDNEGKITITITKPKRFRYYMVSWNWKEENTQQ